MAKTILYFADGTWNGSEQGNNAGRFANESEAPFSPDTNVYKLFVWLQGEPMMTEHHGPGLKSWMKVFPDSKSASVSQMAMYCHGVGDNKWIPIERLLGGAVGAGLTTRLRLGYTFISKHYEPGDKIVIVGFSRGAYTARALADLIANEGLLRKDLANDNKWLSWSAAAWLRYRQSHPPIAAHPSLYARIELLSADVHLELIRKKLDDSDFVPVDKLEAVLVWDTVGAVGVPDFHGQVAEDVFKFDSTDLHPKIGVAVHAVSLDEQRLSFQPTLWKPSPRLIQEVFPGGHADVGGGYHEHQLSDVPFKWAVDKLTGSVPLLLRDAHPEFEVKPDALAQGHREWTKVPAEFRALRLFPEGSVSINEAVRSRMAAPSVLAEEDVREKYDPKNLPKG